VSCRSGLSPHAAELVQLGSDAEGVRFGPPTRNRHYTGFHKFQTLEETSDLLDAAQAVRDRANRTFRITRWLRARSIPRVITDHRIDELTETRR
jgi:hypothetical protein